MGRSADPAAQRQRRAAHDDGYLGARRFEVGPDGLQELFEESAIKVMHDNRLYYPR